MIDFYFKAKLLWLKQREFISLCLVGLPLAFVLGSYITKYHKQGHLTSNRNALLIILEAGKSKTKAPADSGSGKVVSPDSWVASSHCALPWWKQQSGHGGLFGGDVHLAREGSASVVRAYRSHLLTAFQPGNSEGRQAALSGAFSPGASPGNHFCFFVLLTLMSCLLLGMSQLSWASVSISGI